MSLFYNHNPYDYSEREMQRNVVEIINRNGINDVNSHLSVKILTEHSTHEINRRSDIIVYLTDRKIFNIECKLKDINEAILQAIDHLKWADYSFICVPFGTFIRNVYLIKMIENNIGMLMYQYPNRLEEIVLARYNRNKDDRVSEAIRKSIIAKCSQCIAI